jgi:hypothetical protein
MYYDQRDMQAQIDGLYAQDWDVFATLKFADGYKIQPARAQKILLKTWHILDRAYFGMVGVERGVRVQRYAVMHMGKSGKNLHYHCVAHSVGNQTQFCNLLQNVWCNSFAETADITQCDAVPVLDKRAVSVYMYHEFPKLGHNTCVDAVMHTGQATDLGKFRGIQQMRRVLRLMDKIDLGNDLG